MESGVDMLLHAAGPDNEAPEEMWPFFGLDIECSGNSHMFLSCG
jgi:hypothetical protein